MFYEPEILLGIYLLACAEQNALSAGQIIRNIPKGCIASNPVEVHRLP
ncbi:MAG TPA: hypothetical protein VF713_08265 [Thermoanaerobaculia bacterium]